MRIHHAKNKIRKNENLIPDNSRSPSCSTNPIINGIFSTILIRFSGISGRKAFSLIISTEGTKIKKAG